MAASLTCNQQQVTAAVTSQVCPASQELIKIFIFSIKSIFWMINNPAPGHNKRCNWSANLEIQKIIWSYFQTQEQPRLEAGNLNLHQNVTIWLLQVRLASTKGLKDEKSEQSSVSCDGLDDIVMILSQTGLIWECRVSLGQGRDYHSNISGEECETIKVMFTNILYKQTM